MAEMPKAAGLDFSEKVVVIGGGILAAMALTVVNPVLPTIDKELAHSAFDSMLVKQLFGFTSLATTTAMLLSSATSLYAADPAKQETFAVTKTSYPDSFS